LALATLEGNANAGFVKSVGGLSLAEMWRDPEVLRDFYWNQELSTSKIALRCGCVPSTILKWMTKLGIPRRSLSEAQRKVIKSNAWTYEEEKKLRELYPRGSRSEIMKEIPNRSWDCIKARASKLGIRKKFRIYKEIQWNPSPSLCYILGAFLGDGNVAGRKIRLRVTDKEFAEVFAQNLSQLGVRPTLVLKDRPQKNWKPLWHAYGSNKMLVDRLGNITYEEIERFAIAYPLDFLRGIIDSEGNVGVYANSLGAKYARCLIWNSDLRLLEIALSCINKLGYNAVIHDYRQCSKAYSLNLLGGSKKIVKFVSEVNPSIPRKRFQNGS